MKRCIVFCWMVVLALVLSACTHIGKPAEMIGRSDAFLDFGKSAPSSRDMAKHVISGKQPFEWWYFDGHLDTGETFVGTFFDPSFTSGKPGAVFSLYGKDWKKEVWYVILENEDMKVSTREIELSCSAGYIRRLDEKTHRVGWKFDGFQADLVLTTLAPGWKPELRDIVNVEDKHDFFWAVHQGKNRIEGTFTKDGVTRKVSGTGYADHNWGKRSLYEIAHSWVWGRILAGDYTIIYADVHYRDAAIQSRPLYVAKGDAMIIGTGSPTVTQRDFVTHPTLARHYPRQVDIDHVEGGREAHIRIRFKELVEDVDLLAASGLSPVKQWMVRTFAMRPTYFRIIADYSGTIVENGVTVPIGGECLYEIMGLE